MSDAERDAIVAQLQTATAEGRLTLEEFGDRVSRVQLSQTRGDLAVLVDDLPSPSVASDPPSSAPATGAAGGNTILPLLAMIFGIMSLPAGACSPFGGPAGVAGIVLGILGLRSIRQGNTGSRAMAIAGIACGGAGLVAQIVMMIVLPAIFNDF